MNYRHIYHAGNFADVFKHVLIITLIHSLLQKDNPFCYLDTHAGIGLYNLFSTEAQKTLESHSGILQLFNHPIDNMPAIVAEYLAIVRYYNPNLATLRFYPGSPCVANRLLRKNDRIILNELHPDDYQTLKLQFYKDHRVSMHHLDGYQILKALLPPAERRGLVVIDPPFENANEFLNIYQGLIDALIRWQNGIYAIWYPIIQDQHNKNMFINKLKNINAKTVLLAEFSIFPDDSPLGLNGCGMVIVNPPWQLDNQLTIILPWLWQVLSPQKWGNINIKWLKAETN